MAFASDGLTLASADESGMVLLWDLTDRATPQRIGDPRWPATSGGVNSVSVARWHSPLTGGLWPLRAYGGTVLLWDLADRTNAAPPW